METITKDRFAELWKVLVEGYLPSTEAPNGDCAMKISNGVSDRLANTLILCANGEDTCLATKYKVA
jgi:hypothetical protein